MISFNEWNKEKSEETSGIDLDNDNESGESSVHKNKIKKAKKDNLEFLNKRKNGAKEIASNAAAKKNDLTKWHFVAKDKPYQECIGYLNSGRDKNRFLSNYKTLLPKLNNIDNLSQKQFQELMGKIEVYGEVYIKLFGSPQ